MQFLFIRRSAHSSQLCLFCNQIPGLIYARVCIHLLNDLVSAMFFSLLSPYPPLCYLLTKYVVFLVVVDRIVFYSTIVHRRTYTLMKSMACSIEFLSIHSVDTLANLDKAVASSVRKSVKRRKTDRRNFNCRQCYRLRFRRRLRKCKRNLSL